MTNTQLLDQLYEKFKADKAENKKKLDNATHNIDIAWATSKDYTLEHVLLTILMAKCDVLMGKEEIE